MVVCGAILGVLTLLCMPLAGVKGEWLVCYCTEASCVQTNYMCKTRYGSCYSRLTFESGSGPIISSRHGCDDGGVLSSEERHESCQIRSAPVAANEARIENIDSLFAPSFSPSVTDQEDETEFSWSDRRRHQRLTTIEDIADEFVTASSKDGRTEFETTHDFQTKFRNNRIIRNKIIHDGDAQPTGSEGESDILARRHGGLHRFNKQRTTITCCNEDMCNYVGEGERAINKSRDEASINQERRRKTSVRTFSKGIEHLIAVNTLSTKRDYKDLWFKMAVCVITLVGAAILVIIITSAMRMLRSEKHQIWRQQSYCECPHHVIEAILVAGEVSSKQQLLVPIVDECRSDGHCHTPLSLPHSIATQDLV